MGMMSQILGAKKQNPFVVSLLNDTGRSPRDPIPDSELLEKIPCPKCLGDWFWESIYFDGVLRCGLCTPHPGWEMVGRTVCRKSSTGQDATLRAGFDQRITDGIAPQNLKPDWQEREEQAAQERSESGEPGDEFVEYLTADGRTAYALRGFNNLRHRNYNQRACMYEGIGVAKFDRYVPWVK